MGSNPQRDSNPCLQSATRFLTRFKRLRAVDSTPRPRDLNSGGCFDSGTNLPYPVARHARGVKLRAVASAHAESQRVRLHWDTHRETGAQTGNSEL